MTSAETRYQCPVCAGFQGWDRSTGRPMLPPENELEREQWMQCVYCKGEGLAEKVPDYSLDPRRWPP